jgi:hypothetical protein
MLLQQLALPMRMELNIPTILPLECAILLPQAAAEMDARVPERALVKIARLLVRLPARALARVPAKAPAKAPASSARAPVATK